MDRLAGESVRFTNPKPEALPTIQTRRAIHTGRRVFPFGNHQSAKGDSVRVPGWAPIPERDVTLSEIMRNAGYHTGLVTDTYHQFKPSMNFHRGFDQFHWIRGQEQDCWQSLNQIGPDEALAASVPAQHNTFGQRRIARYLANISARSYEEEYFAPRVFSEAMRFCEDNHNKDFLLVVDSFDPHEPFDPPPWYVDRYAPGYRGTDLIWPSYGPCDNLSAEQVAMIRALYAGEVTMVDRWLGIFLDHCHDLGIMDDTILIVLSDHGHSLGERGVMGKLPAYSYPELVDIIMMVRRPGGAGGGQTCDSFVYTHEVAPTILGQLGIAPPLPMHGRDLLAIADGQQPGRSYAVSGYSNYVVYADADYWYLSDHDRTDERLFALAADPGCETNIATTNVDRCNEFFSRCRSEAGGSFPVTDPEQLRQSGPWYEMV